jgi:uncharacterized protein YggT (Ycf19 family)
MMIAAGQLVGVLSFLATQLFASGTFISQGLAQVIVLLFLPSRLRAVIRSIIELYALMVLIWAILSWVRDKRGFVRDIYNMLDVCVEPYVSIFRRFVPPTGMLDLSSFVALVVLQLLAALI